MFHLGIRFPAGRYHATPWGRHVNEGAIEWPPSPWRIARALIACGFANLGWTSVPEDARALIEALAATSPVYLLPRGTAGHTRHYMPRRDGNTSRIIDAFVYVGREARLGVEWSVVLDARSRELLARLVPLLPYLGRAESWIDAAVADGPFVADDEQVRCASAEAPPGPDHERIEVLAPMDTAAFDVWRALVSESQSLTGASSRGKRASKPGSDQLVPGSVTDCLLLDTARLQADGWSQPPGSRWLSYWRPVDAVVTVPRAAPRITLGRAVEPTMALLALASDARRGDVLPRMFDAVRRMEGIHTTLVKLSAEAGEPSPCFTGRDADGRLASGHRHATLIPVDVDDDGRMDHVLVSAPMGLDTRARRALSRIRRTYAKGISELFVTLAGFGAPGDFGERCAPAGRARVWRSSTPFVPPRFLKARGANSLEGQVRAELASRGLPEPIAVEVEIEDGARAPSFAPACAAPLLRARPASVQLQEEGDVASAERRALLATRWRHYRCTRSGDAKSPPMSVAFGLRITFVTDVAGPISLGYGSHFGLGVMIPEPG